MLRYTLLPNGRELILGWVMFAFVSNSLEIIKIGHWSGENQKGIAIVLNRIGLVEFDMYSEGSVLSKLRSHMLATMISYLFTLFLSYSTHLNCYIIVRCLPCRSQLASITNFFRIWGVRWKATDKSQPSITKFLTKSPLESTTYL